MKITELPNGKNLLNGSRWIGLKQACDMKNLSYKTCCNKTYFQPLNGQAENGGNGFGPKEWRAETILEWLEITNQEMYENWKAQLLKSA